MEAKFKEDRYRSQRSSDDERTIDNLWSMYGLKTFLTGETKENQEFSLEFVGYQVLNGVKCLCPYTGTRSYF